MIGGFVVRDPGLPTLVGRYVFGDQSKADACSPPRSAPRPTPRAEPALPVGARRRRFGEDGCGHVYVAALDGVVSRIQDGAVSPCPAGGPAVPGAPGARRRRARRPRGCGLRVRAPRAQRGRPRSGCGSAPRARAP